MPAKKKTDVKKGWIRPDTYRVMDQAVETGVSLGWNRAHKHTDAPTEQQVKDAIHRAVLDEIGEWFRYDDEGQE